MRSARATSASVATWTPPSGTGCSGSSGICRSTAAVHNRISWRAVGLSAARAGSPSAPTTSCSGVARSEYANPSVTTPYTTFPVSCFPFPVSRLFDPDDRADPNGGLVRGPEVELVGGRGLQLRGDDVADRWGGRGGGFSDHVPVFGSRE